MHLLKRLCQACVIIVLAEPGILEAQSAGSAADRLPAEDLEELLAPIALYPDTLLANMLAAAVYADDAVQAAAHVARGQAVTEESSTEWDPSVKAVAMFPDAIKLFGDYPDWADALGQAYLAQPEEVMAAVQTLRARAYANEALRSSAEQNVIVEGETIVVEPANPQMIYVPRYDPVTVYVESRPRRADVAIAFGAGIAIGAIHQALYCDWRRRTIIWSPRPGYWGPAWRPYYRPGLHGCAWRPVGRPRPIRPGWNNTWRGVSVRPNIAVMPGRPPGSRPNMGNWRPPRPVPRPSEVSRPRPPRPRPPGSAVPLPSRPDRIPALRPPAGGSARPSRPSQWPDVGNRPSRPGGLGSMPAPRPRPSMPSNMTRPAPPRDSGFNRPTIRPARAPSRPSNMSPGGFSRPQRPSMPARGSRGRRR